MPNKSIVSIIPLDNYDDQACVDKAVHDALEPFGGMAHFVKPGQKVLLKPNLVAPAKPELAVTTHPAILRAVIRKLNACQAEASVGDGPGVSTTTAAARAAGLLPVIQEEHAQLVDFQETKRYENQDNTVVKHLDLTDHLSTHDVLITLPKLKTHCLMAMTCALKNQYGLIPGVAKSQFHFRFQNRRAFADLVIDINKTAKPALAIVDAVIAMEGPGPSGGTPRKIGLVIAGDDLAAVDAVAATLITLKPDDVPLIEAAKRANYGNTSLENIDVRGAKLEDFIVNDFKTVRAPANIMRILPLPVFMLKWLRRHLVPKPVINPDKCIKCGRCHDGCPVKPAAINPLQETGDKLNDKTCIRCYCCHEFCPVKAIDLKRSFLDRYFHILAIAKFGHALFGKFVALIRH